MRIYRITKSYSYENGQYGGPVVWFHLFKRTAIRLAARLAEDFNGVNQGPSQSSEGQPTVALFNHPRNEHWIVVDAVHLNIFQPFSAMRRWIRRRVDWQNLNEVGAGHGSILRHGRAWYRPANYFSDNKRHSSLAWSWNFEPRRWFGLSVDLFDGDSERDLGFSVHLGFAHFWLTFENVLNRWGGYPRHSWAHTWGVTLFEDHLNFQIHNAGSDCYDCKGWKGWHKGFFVSNLIFGRTKHEQKVLSVHEAVVPMPEGNYPATVKIVEDSWKWSRWPWPKVRLASEIEVKGGVPFPGKGENSWDCGEDAIISTGSSTPTVAGAVGAMVSSVLRNRERYGGKNWVPERRLTA